MCLDKITEKAVDENELIRCGWKEFSGTGTDLKFQNQALGDTKIVPLDRWIKADATKVGSSWRSQYQSGFHIYSDETELYSRTSHHRVYYRGVETIGIQDGKTVVIARWMFVPSDPDAWPPLRK